MGDPESTHGTDDPRGGGVETTRHPWMVPGAGVAAVGGAMALAACNAIVNLTPGMRDVADTADLVELVGEQPLLTEAASLVGVLATLLLVPGIWAVASRLAPRTPRLAAVGGWAMASGYVASMVLHSDYLTVLGVARAGGDPSVFVEAVDQHTSPVSIAVYAIFGIGALGGGLVLGVAMLRQRDTVPAWAGWSLVASEPVRVLGLLLGVPLGPPAASLLIAVAFLGVLRTDRDPGVRSAARARPVQRAVD